MHHGKKIVVVMPAYNAASTLKKTYEEVMEQGIVDLVIVVDDCSHDDTVAVAKSLPNTVVHQHADNRGYGANQKTCYDLALKEGGDIVIMVHPDYQYTPRLIPAIAATTYILFEELRAAPIETEQSGLALQSRFLGLARRLRRLVSAVPEKG